MFSTGSGWTAARAFGSAAVILLALGGGAAPGGASEVNGVPAVRVRIHDIAFMPQTLRIVAGTPITWTNDDDMAHTVTSGVDRDDGAWAGSPSIPPGSTFTLTLTKPGTYRFFCKPHVYNPAMHGTIVVVPSAGA